jgi:dipeptidyl aminopeptidase/acylaminoacyl peptidase
MRAAAIGLILWTITLTGQQAPPATEVYLVDASKWSEEKPPVLNISNDPDYDNQPSFLPDSSAVLFASRRDGKQTDIYRYDIASKKLTQLTKTPESEYSPTVTPDGKTFSVIRVEADNTQRLWRFDLDGSNPRLVLENVKPVGYHAWIDATHLALFVLGSGNAPATLQIADTATGKAEVIETGIGRSILIRPGRGTVSYMTTGASRQVKEWDPKTRAPTTLFPPLEGSQDAAWLRDGSLLMATGTQIFLRKASDTEWSTLALNVWSLPAVKSITRLAISPDGKWLAFVAEPAAAK